MFSWTFISFEIKQANIFLTHSISLSFCLLLLLLSRYQSLSVSLTLSLAHCLIHYLLHYIIFNMFWQLVCACVEVIVPLKRINDVAKQPEAFLITLFHWITNHNRHTVIISYQRFYYLIVVLLRYAFTLFEKRNSSCSLCW